MFLFVFFMEKELITKSLEDLGALVTLPSLPLQCYVCVQSLMNHYHWELVFLLVKYGPFPLWRFGGLTRQWRINDRNSPFF